MGMEMTTYCVCLCLTAFAAASAQAVGGRARLLRPDVCIVGGGSGGIGAAIAASRAGANVILIEKQARLGGTSTRSYVCNWEPGPGDAIAREIYDRLCKITTLCYINNP